MRRTPLSGGCLLRGSARPTVLATVPWISTRHRYYCGHKLQSSASTHDGRTGDSGLALEHVLTQLRKAQGIDRLGPNVEAVVSGRGKHLGIAVNWNLRWTAAGSFAEEIRGPQLTFKWGYDGRQDSGCWEVDSSGLVRVMECDDHEAVLMTTYIRTGCWLQPQLQDRFEMELLPTPAMAAAGPSSSTSGTGSGGSSPSRASSSSSSKSGAVPGIGGRSTGSTGRADEAAVVRGGGRSLAAASASGAAPEAAAAAARPAARRGGAGAGAGGGRSAASPPHGSAGLHASGSASAADEVIAIGLRVRGRRLRVRVLVRRRDWRLLGFDHRMCADVETWELGEWREWAEGVRYPSSALHKASNGGQHAYLTSAGAAHQMAPLPPLPDAAAAAICGWQAGPGPAASSGAALASASLPSSPLPAPTDFGLPLLPPIPGDTSYLFQGGRQAVPLWRAASGHYLVRPSINGQEGGGYFVLDTGASGFVITPQAAARLGGQSFGETHAASISGKVAARFVRLGCWGLGGMSIRQPVLMVMELEGLVRGPPGEVVGIVGHDLFRRAVVELPQLLGVPQATSASRSRSGSESGSEDEAGAMPWEAAGGRREAVASTLVSTSASGHHTAAGGVAADATAPPFGPPPPAPRSTPAFDDDATAVASVGARSGAVATAARSQPASVTASAVPSPSIVFEPAPSSPAPGKATFTEGGSHAATSGGRGGSGAVSDADGAPSAGASAATPSRTSSGAADPGSSSSSSNGSYSSSAGASEGGSSGRSSSSGSSGIATGAGSNNSSSRSDSYSSSSTSSRSGSSGGGGSGSRTSAGRSATARAVRRAARTVPYTLHEMALHHPLEYGNESEWVWEPLVMIANLPHVHLRFADPRVGGAPHSALLMVDSGACGADLMLHARAQKELGLVLGGFTGAGGGSRSQGHYLRGVGQDPKDLVQLQVLDLPWLEVAGVRFEQVRCMCAALGGLDISIYSHGILCGDLLARLEWAIDYTHKRIGFRRGAAAPAPHIGR